MDEELSAECALWGEPKPTHSTAPWGQDVFNNVEQDAIIHSIQNISFKKYFCNQEESSSEIEMKNEIQIDDPLKRTVKLLKYKNDLRNVIDHNKLQPGLFDIEEQLRNISTPPATEQKKDNSKLILFKHVKSNFLNGVYSDPPLNITEESALAVLRNSVATVLAFVGFTETTIMPLQILTEVTENYILKFLKLLRLNLEKERLRGESGFCDIVDRTFHEMGIGSVRNLASYYQENVLNLRTKKVKSCKEELIAYEDSVQKLREEKKQHILHLNLQDVEEENLVIPELHVTSLVGNDLLTGSFETGLQMLQTLERQQYSSCRLNDEGSSDLSMGDINELRNLKRKRKL